MYLVCVGRSQGMLARSNFQQKVQPPLVIMKNMKRKKKRENEVESLQAFDIDPLKYAV